MKKTFFWAALCLMNVAFTPQQDKNYNNIIIYRGKAKIPL